MDSPLKKPVFDAADKENHANGIADKMSASDDKQAAPSGDEVIRGWTKAMYDGDYDRAARYFAKDAIIQQVETIYLRTHEDAVAWGRSLPCRAKVTGIKRESPPRSAGSSRPCRRAGTPRAAPRRRPAAAGAPCR